MRSLSCACSTSLQPARYGVNRWLGNPCGRIPAPPISELCQASAVPSDPCTVPEVGVRLRPASLLDVAIRDDRRPWLFGSSTSAC
jgi:hypothetical protein